MSHALERWITERDAVRIAALLALRRRTHPRERDDLDALADVVDGAHPAPSGWLPHDTVVLGSTVTLRMADDAAQRVVLVEPGAVDAARGLISVVSPLGRSLLGVRAGERVVVDRPDGTRHEVEIVEVEGGGDEHAFG